ncbi:MAG TPA: tetratricopeptide repeat protein [Candidatus Limnocylindrales bacterium]|nr:tetratricopeptide repeat protein [Candidatus Limnocylindrales bacterium]
MRKLTARVHVNLRRSSIGNLFRRNLPAACAVAFVLAFGASFASAQDHAQSATYYTGITVEPSQQLFATMCALDAAGFAAEEATLAEMPSRLALREDLLKMQGPATEALRAFYKDHLLADPGETLSRYITFALVTGPPPHFDFRMDRDILPPGVLAIEGFQPILAEFYQEARLDLRWAKVEPEYNRAILRYQPMVRRIVIATNAYFREVLKPIYGRTFTVYIEPLVGNRTNFRNYGDHYAIVLGTSPQIPVDEIQHAYLHFMLDPLPLRHRKDVDSKKQLMNIAARAPRLPITYHDDFPSFVDECLIKAVELRLRHLSPAALEAAVKDADESGYILVRPFVRGLQKFEKSEPAITYYFPDLLAGIDVEAEQARLKDFHFAPIQPPAPPKEKAESAAAEPSNLDSEIAQGNRDLAVQNAAAARTVFEQVLAEHPGEPRALYGLAIASVLSGDADRATELFSRLISPPAAAGTEPTAPAADPAIVSWSHVYLGRIHDLEEDRQKALGEYHAALAVAGAPEAARVAAQRGIETPYQTPKGADEKR